MKRILKAAGGGVLFALLLSLIYNLLFLSALLLSVLLFKDSFGAVLMILMMCADSVLVIIASWQLLGLKKRFGIFQGYVLSLSVAIDLIAFFTLWRSMTASFEQDVGIIAVVGYCAALVPVVVAAIVCATRETTPRQRLDPESSNYLKIERKNIFYIGVTLCTTAALALVSYGVFAGSINMLKQLPDDADIVSVAKGGDRIYLITADGDMYMNGNNVSEPFCAAYGFSSYNLYDYRGFAGVSRPVLVRGGVADVVPTATGGLFITRSGELYAFDKELAGFRYPVKIASDVRSADIKGGYVFYTDSGNRLFCRNIGEREQSVFIADGIVKAEFTSDCVALLTDTNKLCLNTVKSLTETKTDELTLTTVANDVTSFSSRNCAGFLAYTNKKGDCLVTTWSIFNNTCYINSSAGMPTVVRSGNAVEVCSGYLYTAITLDDGRVLLRGNGAFSDEGVFCSERPIDIAADFKSISAIMPDGSLIGCGDTGNGQLGLLDMSKAENDGGIWKMFTDKN